MRTTNIHTLADIISNLFSPLVVLPVTFVIYILNLPILYEQRVHLMVLVFVFGILPVIAVLVLFKKLKLISDWDIRIRNERHRFNSVVVVIVLLLFYILYSTNNTVLFDLLLVLVVWMVLFSLITLFWKVSGHTGCMTLAVLIISRFYPPFIPIGIICILLVAWARITNKNHTPAQTIGGILLSVGVFQLVQRFFI